MLPSQVLTDLRYVSLPAKMWAGMLEAFIATLPPAPSDGSVDEADAALEAERRRER